MNFEQLITYDHTDQPDGVVNFRIVDVLSFYVGKAFDGDTRGLFCAMRVRGNQNAYRVKYDDLKQLINKKKEV